MGDAVSKDCAGLIRLELMDPAEEEEQEAPMTGSVAADADDEEEEEEEEVGDSAMAPGDGANDAGMLVGGCCRFLIMSL